MKGSEGTAALVRGLRHRLHLTQEQFAHRIGVTYSTVNHWENGKRVPQPFLTRRLLELKDELDTRSQPPAADATLEPEARGAGGGPTDATATPGPRTGALRREIPEMVDRIAELFRPEKVILFGSHARGEAGPDSDVDLLVVMRVRGSRREAQVQVRLALHDIHVPKDVIVTTPEDFEWRRRIVGTIERAASREGKVLHARG
jgi:predicted nucleotidyltransferase/DNA-binding XRE family transcriptional regulator